MSTILVVDDVGIFQDPIAASLRLAGYDTRTASNGAEACAAVVERPVDLVLLDVAMPGMDGLAFLQFLRNHAPTRDLPVILLTALAERDKVMRAAKLGVREYLLKSRFSLQELLARVAKYVPRPTAPAAPATPAADPVKAPAPAKAAPAPAAPVAARPAAAPAPETGVPALLTRDACLQRIQTALKAKSLSGVVARVIGLADSARGDMSDLADLISRDPHLAARVVRAANSAAFRATRGVVTTIPDAVRNVGCATVRNLAIAMGVFDAMPEAGPDAFDPVRCWQHSFAVAHLCERLAEEGGAADPGHAYLVGLCHDLCEVLVRTTFAAEYRQLLDAQSRLAIPADQLHRAMLGLSHAEMATAILKVLALPAAISEPIHAFHVDPPADPRREPPLTGLLRLADAYATGLQLAPSARATLRAFDAAEARRLAGLPHPARPDGQAMRDEVRLLTAMLAHLPGPEGATTLTPLHPRLDLPICLARDEGLSRFDPIEAALESLADCQTLAHLPGPGQCADRAALVVLARHPGVPGFTRGDVARAASTQPHAPVLWLVGRAEPGAAAVNPHLPAESIATAPWPTAWPVSLDMLAQFVASLDEPHAAAA